MRAPPCSALVGSNFAPTDFLWCRFGVPSETRRAAGRALLPRGLPQRHAGRWGARGYAGDFSVSASHDDRMYSDDYKEWRSGRARCRRLCVSRLRSSLAEAVRVRRRIRGAGDRGPRAGAHAEVDALRWLPPRDGAAALRGSSSTFIPARHVLRDEPRCGRPRSAAAGADVVQAPNGIAVPSNRPGERMPGYPRTRRSTVPGSGVL